MSMKIRTNLDTLAEHIGSYMGMADGVQQKIYVDGLITNAHRLTVPDFTKAAALNAKRHNFVHMYEYGVRGITRGDGQTLDPTSQRARLWRDVLLGAGSRKTITFVYRNATQRVPKHTTADTGVAQEELDKLKINQGKKYVFFQKAEVFEEGIDVNIFPKQRDGRLFVPLRGTSFRSSPRDQERGFTFVRKLHINPGEMSGATGQFSFYFFDWWSSTGNALMAKRMDARVVGDIKRKQAELATLTRGMKSPTASNPKAAAAEARGKTRKQFTVWARREEGMKEVVL